MEIRRLDVDSRSSNHRGSDVLTSVAVRDRGDEGVEDVGLGFDHELDLAGVTFVPADLMTLPRRPLK